MKRAGAVACGALALAGAFAGGLVAFHDGGGSVMARAIEPRPAWHQGPIFGIGPFPARSEPERPPLALEQVRLAFATAFYRHVTAEMLTKPTIGQIVEAVDDPYTEYLDPEAYERLQDDLERRYSGIGLLVSPAEAGLVVTGALAGPGRAAGIRPGDVIVAIDGRSAGGLPFDRSTALLKGEEGTRVSLEIRRPGLDEPLLVELARGDVSVPPVRSRLLEGDGSTLGYVRLDSFSADASERVAAEVLDLLEKGAQGIVLDLRSDPGGYLAQAVRVASLFLESGLVCRTAGANQESRAFTVSGAAVEVERPLVVLVDGRTASAAEIVAAALRDNGRAVVVGARTYGKATVQSVIALSNGGALRLTTSSYVTPKGRSIAHRGIKPKVRAVDDPTTRRDEALDAARAVLAELLAA